VLGLGMGLVLELISLVLGLGLISMWLGQAVALQLAWAPVFLR